MHGLALRGYISSDDLDCLLVSPLDLCNTCSAASSPKPQLLTIPPPCFFSILYFPSPYNITISFSFMFHTLFFFLLGAPHWDRGQGVLEDPMCVFMCAGQETAEENLSENSAFLVMISHLHLDSCASNILFLFQCYVSLVFWHGNLVTWVSHLVA